MKPTSIYLNHFDPYDVWSFSWIGNVKARVYAGSFTAKILAAGIVFVDWLAPLLFRRFLGVDKDAAAHTVAQLFMAVHVNELDQKSANEFVEYVSSLQHKGGWGLPFPWYSKNGVYPNSIPYVTNTPYVMEALLRVLGSCEQPRARDLFNSTWDFLESLQVMYEDGECIAVSYAPVDEPRIVINANSYSALAYAMHAIYGKEEHLQLARLKAIQLVRWVVNQQNSDGSWFYYADSEQGNFIDCFHSCFLLKNLHKITGLIPEVAADLQKPIEDGFCFVQQKLFDEHSGLCRRFVEMPLNDLFRWDLYDQAEYLGVLIDFGMIDEAVRFREHVTKHFSRGEDWWCRIDVFGRRWGKNFLRWGIVPMAYQSARLDAAIKKV